MLRSFWTEPIEQFLFALAQIFEGRFAVNGLNAPTPDVIVAAGEQVADFGDFREVSCHGVLRKFVGRATALRGWFA